MVRSYGRKLGTHWPMLFTAGVATYFFIVAIHAHVHVAMPSVPDRIHTVTAAKHHTAATKATTTTSPESAASDIRFSVTSFHVTPDKHHLGKLDANLTLNVHNATNANIVMHSDQVVLKQSGTSNPTPTNSDASPTLAPHLSMIVPVSFVITPSLNGKYELQYAGKTIFTGTPT